MIAPVESIAEAFVGCLMVDHSILEQTGLGASMVPGKAGAIFQAMRRLSGSGVVPDFETLYMDPSLSEARGLILELQERSFTAVNWEVYEKQLIENWRLKKLIGLGKIVSDGQGTSEELASLVEKQLLEIRNIGSKNDILPIESYYLEWGNRLTERQKNRGQIPGVSWGMGTIDACTLGACKNQLVVIGARPSEGKSAIAVQMARHQAFKENVNVGIITIESDGMEITSRFIAGGVPIDGMKVSLGNVTEQDKTNIRFFVEGALQKSERLFIYDRPGATIQEVWSAARRMVMVNKIKVLYIDYLQLIHAPKSENKIAEVGYVSVALKEIARELGICVVVLAQLKRDEKNVRPTMGSIQWASAVEQTADQVWLIYHKRDDNNKITESKIILEKVRDGRTLDIKVRFDKTIVSFFEIEEERK